MSNAPDNSRYLRRRSRAVFASGVASIALLLALLGLLALVATLGKAVAASARASVPVRIFLHDGIGEEQRAILAKKLQRLDYVQRVTFTSKDSAAAFWKARTGEDVTRLMEGANPLLASLDVQLRAEAISAAQVTSLQDMLAEEVIVANVAYPSEMLFKAEKNIQTIGWWAVGLGIPILLIVLYLVFASIRMAIYAERLTIRTMQLIGATAGFIRRPFVLRGFAQGAVAGFLAAFILMILLASAKHFLPMLALPYTLGQSEFVGVLSGIVLFGAVLGIIGSTLAVNRYLFRNIDEIM